MAKDRGRNQRSFKYHQDSQTEKFAFSLSVVALHFLYLNGGQSSAGSSVGSHLLDTFMMQTRGAHFVEQTTHCPGELVVRD